MSTWITNSTIGSPAKIIDYKIVYSAGPDGLTEDVCQLIQEGWQPLGSPYIILLNDEDEWHHQAMVKYES